NAVTLLKDVLDACSNPASGASLVPYDKVFATDNEMNAEIIFAVRYRSGNVGIGSPFTTLFGPINNAGNVVIGSPKHYDFPSDNLIAAYSASDKRKDVVLQEGYLNNTTGLWVADRFCNKFIDKNMTTEYDAENDWPVIRLADVMLLYAEALNETSGPSDDALTQLNAIRQRAGVPDYTLAELSSKYLFRQAVRNERRLEFAMENQRWFDLMRWGTAVSTVNDFISGESFYSAYDYVVNPIEEWQVLLPIPISVTNINDQIAQNPGY
ncbi:MAG: RagB/SusD family nutrient uptake outer membrane protein, partial [Candidatus Cryptobacteroides sp.]